MDRRNFLIIGAAATALAGRAAAQGQRSRIEAYKSPTCGCCSAWVDRMDKAGFDITAQNIDQEQLWALKERSGIVPDISGCHTAFVDDYVIEGHVPASDIERLLAERPEAIGLAVPGMPIGAPGMDMGNRREAFDTLLVLPDGTTEVFQSHA